MSFFCTQNPIPTGGKQCRRKPRRKSMVKRPRLPRKRKYNRKSLSKSHLDACISAEDDHKLLKAMRKARTTPILILSSQSCHVERLRVLQAGAHAYIGHPYSMEECLAQAQALMQLYWLSFSAGLGSVHHPPKTKRRTKNV